MIVDWALSADFMCSTDAISTGMPADVRHAQVRGQNAME